MTQDTLDDLTFGSDDPLGGLDTGPPAMDLFDGGRSVRDVHTERSELAQARDEATTADEVTLDFNEWRNNPDELDYPGIDTANADGSDIF